MAYFLPSFLQKRILRYALSRLDLLDTDALDLDHLDIAWGKRSVVELKGVGMHAKKLTAFLKLPQGFAVTKARISLLRLTVPADLYNGGILVEVDGVEVRLTASTGDRECGGQVGQKQRRGHRPKVSKGMKADFQRSTQSHVHDPGGQVPQYDSGASDSEDENEDSDQMPNTVDLAQSFLQAGPKEEETELQAAIAQSQYLNQSQALSDDGEENSALGIGSTLSLPGFLAGFLKGVVDRIQLNAKNVEVNLDLKLDISPDGSASIDMSERSEVVTVRLTIKEITLGGVMPDSEMLESRNISMNTIEAMLRSEPSMFANLARSTAPSSPEIFHTSTMETTKSKTAGSLSSSPDQEDTFQNNSGYRNSDRPSPQKFESPLATSQIGALPSSQGLSETSDITASASGHTEVESLYEDDIFTDSFYSNDRDHCGGNVPAQETEMSPERSMYDDALNHAASSLNSMRSNVRSARESPRGNETPPARFNAFSTSRPSQDNLPVLTPDDEHMYMETSIASSADIESRPISHNLSPESEQGSPSSEDLTQSRIFSHEQATSMYMSAVSHVSMQGNGVGSMPGGWRSSYEGPNNKELFANDDIVQRGILKSHQAQTESPQFDHHPGPEGNERSATPTSSMADLKLDPHLTSVPKAVLLHEFPQVQTEHGNIVSKGFGLSSTGFKNHLTLVKKIFVIDVVSLKLPQGSSLHSTESTEPQIRTSSRNNTVTAGTVHGSEVESGVTTSIAFNPTNSASHIFQAEKNGTDVSSITIDVGKIQIVGDMGLTRVTILALEQLSALRQPASIGIQHGGTKDQRLNQSSNFILSVKSIDWEFLDLVKEKSPANIDFQTPEEAGSLSNGSDVLLRANVSNVQATCCRASLSSTSRISIGKFSFGYALDDILSFDTGLKIKESTRDILAPVDNDMVLTITKTNHTWKTDLTTLPLHVTLDLRRLDETFGWFGGLSSMLGLGSSMISTVTIVDAKPKPSPPRKTTRGVHFETPISSRPTLPKFSQKKITARIGGLVFDLQGTQSNLRLESTAMKLVSRSEGVGLQVDRMKLSGPHLEPSMAEPSIVVKSKNLRVEYLSTPNEGDLARLLALLSPSKDKYERDDDILLDTLLRQRRQGGVIRVTVESSGSWLSDMDDLQCFSTLSQELKKLSTVAKYLPQDDRPGVLILGLVKDFKFGLNVSDNFGTASLTCKGLELSHVTFPSLFALSINGLQLYRNEAEELIVEAVPAAMNFESSLPMVMVRFIGNEMEPIAKIKLHNVRLEYHVSTIMAIMGLEEGTTAESIIADMVSSVATLTDGQPNGKSPPKLSSQGSTSSENSIAASKLLKLDITFRDSAIGLNPRGSAAKGLFVLTDTHFVGSMPKSQEASATLEIKKASIMIIDEERNILPLIPSGAVKSHDSQSSQTHLFSQMGYVSVSQISAAKVMLQVVKSITDSGQSIDVEIKDDLFVLESCADSTQTLQSIMNGLTRPVAPSKEFKYRTEVVPVEDMLASFSGDAFAAGKSSNACDADIPLGLDEGDMVDDEVPQNLEFVRSFYNPEPDAIHEDITDSMLDDDLESLTAAVVAREIGGKNLLVSVPEQAEVAPGNAPLEFLEDHFGTNAGPGSNAQKSGTKRNSYTVSNQVRAHGSSLRVRVRDVHIIWNLFDGYDWQSTRDTISQAIADVQGKATERMLRKDKRRSFNAEEEEDDIIGDFLFNSIYIGIPANRDPHDLARQVNRNLDDLASETGSYATTTTGSSPSQQGHSPRPQNKRLRLSRSKHHKMSFELKGVAADVVVYEPGSGEAQSSIDIHVQDLEIFDHVPTSTWKKFATYMHDAGEREIGTSMIHIEILNVKPVPTLAASEILLRATILPLRLHIDQDALDFISRFFEFKPDSALNQSSRSEAPFLQRVEVNSVRVKLDFKPKRVDYAGIRSGRTTEFMNFFILDRADMVLRHVIIYGVSGFDKLGKTLNDIWMPDIKRNQLPGVLAGLAPVRSLVNVGGGVRDLVIIPIREYKKDGRVVRNFQKGAIAFAKTTTSELVKLGAKLAIGTQTVLQSAEDLLNQSPAKRSDVPGGWEDAELDEEEKKQISLYAEQPIGVVQGLRGAYFSLERDLLTAKDAIVAMPGEILESGTAGGAAKAVLRGAPTVILRPAIGVSTAVGQTLMGATNSLDPGNRRRIEEKYKRH